MKGIIYKYTSPSGKHYIGQTRQEDVRKYRFNNLNQSYGSAKINNARKKYGPENFEYEILFEVNKEDENNLIEVLGEKEEYFIREFNSITNGYNYQEGGIHIVNILSKEARASQTEKVSKPILQYSLGGKLLKEWKSTMDIERELDIHHSLISANCVGRTSHCREFIFKHKTDDYKEIIEVEKIKINNTKRIQICQLDLNGNEINRWKSVSDAARKTNIDRNKLKKLAENEEIYNNYIYKIMK